jgi:hypothetical protein
MMKILNVYWFSGGGIVEVETDYDGVEYRIGTWGPLGGLDEEKDADFIAEWGNKFPDSAGKELFK